MFPTHGVQLDLSADKGFHDKFDQLGVTDLWVSHHAGCSWKRISPKNKKEKIRKKKRLGKKKQRKSKEKGKKKERKSNEKEEWQNNQ